MKRKKFHSNKCIIKIVSKIFIPKRSYLLYWICDDKRFEIRKIFFSVNPLHLIFRNINGYFEEINKSKCLALFLTKKAKKK